MENFLKNQIRVNNNGFLTFHEFINFVLYHPEFGYYNRDLQKIGSGGDFYTSSNVSDIFGRTLGKWFVHIFRNFEISETIVELGAGTGKIAHSILAVIKEIDEQLFSKLTYTLVETSGYHQMKQKETLKDYDNVLYLNSLEEMNEVNGIVFSNEFFDAFPVHIIEKKHGKLYELVVAVENDALVEKLIPLQNLNINRFLQQQNLLLDEGQRMEIPLAMEHYYRTLTSRIQKGLLLTIDYGYTKEEWSNQAHRLGSIRGYKQHRMIADILKYPGEMDITTHIHWDFLRFCPKNLEMETVAFMPQNEFLISCGIFTEFNETASLNPFSLEHKRNRAIRTLIEPGQISSYFKALVQTKNIRNASKSLFTPLVKK